MTFGTEAEDQAEDEAEDQAEDEAGIRRGSGRGPAACASPPAPRMPAPWPVGV
jgi:hypothetical protein